MWCQRHHATNQAARMFVSFTSSAHRSHLHLLSAAAAVASKQAAAAAAAAMASSITLSCQHLQQCCQCTAGWLSGAASAQLAASAVRLVHCCGSCAHSAQLVVRAVHVAHSCGSSAPGAPLVAQRCVVCTAVVAVQQCTAGRGPVRSGHCSSNPVRIPPQARRPGRNDATRDSPRATHAR